MLSMIKEVEFERETLIARAISNNPL